MILRLSRLRFIVVRSCFISFIIILFLQLLAYFNHDDNHPHPSNKLLTIEQIFWEKIFREDGQLSNEERIKRIQVIDNKEELNWTGIFFDNYRKKLAIFNERNLKTKYKYQFEENQTNISQEIFEIYEETLVSDIPFHLLKIFGCLGLSTTEILLLNSYISSSMSLFELSMEL